MSELYKKFGELLKLERKRKGIKLEEVSEQLKISEVNLQHIEEGEVTSLPSQIYYNLFAKAYAESLGIDYQRTIEAIKEDIGEAVENHIGVRDTTPAKAKQAEPAKSAEAEKKADENGLSVKKLLYILGGIVIVFIVFIVVYLAFFASESGVTDETRAPSEPVETTQTEPSQTEPAEEQGEFEWEVVDYSKPQKMTLRLIPRSQSWSTVLADGDTAIFRNLIPGRIYDVEAMYRMTVSVGIPSQVDVELNGQPVNLRDTLTGRISRVEINQLNLQEILSRVVEIESTSPPPPSPVQPSPQDQTIESDSSADSSSDRGGNDET